MKKQNSSSKKIVIVAPLLLFLATWVAAERPNRSKKHLISSASHVVNGVVAETYSRSESKENFVYTYYVVEVAVNGVEKGEDIVAGDRLFLRCWRRVWAGDSPLEEPGYNGQRYIPAEGDIVEVSLEGSRKTGFDVLIPNGFFRPTEPLATSEQGGADQPATAPESKPKGNEKPQPESEVRPQ